MDKPKIDSTRMQKQRKMKQDFADFLKTFDPKFVRSYEEDGLTINVYEGR